MLRMKRTCTLLSKFKKCQKSLNSYFRTSKHFVFHDWINKLSNVTFSNEELSLLKIGFKFGVLNTNEKITSSLTIELDEVIEPHFKIELGTSAKGIPSKLKINLNHMFHSLLKNRS